MSERRRRSGGALAGAVREGVRHRRAQEAQQVALAAGGLWSAGEVAVALGVQPSDVVRWREQRRVLAVAGADGAPRYPGAQFDTGWPGRRGRPVPEMAAVLLTASTRTAEELLGVLATPQTTLALRDGRARNGWAALAAGDGARVAALLARNPARDDRPAEYRPRAGAERGSSG